MPWDFLAIFLNAQMRKYEVSLKMSTNTYMLCMQMVYDLPIHSKALKAITKEIKAKNTKSVLLSLQVDP